MKSGIGRNFLVGVLAMFIPLAAWCLAKGTNSPPALSTLTAPSSDASPEAAGVQDSAAESATHPSSPAPQNPVASTKPLPPNLNPSRPLAEVIKLADSGVEEGVLLAVVTNSPSTFNLGVDEIIYLNDIGVPADVVTAMIQRDQAIQAASAQSAPPVSEGPANGPEMGAMAPPATPPEVAPAQEPPPPDYTGGGYPAPAPAPPPVEDVSYNDFYGSLAPYGNWVNVDGYGPCWQPTVSFVNPGWQPYFDGGCWAYTDCGWYWASNYSWGWAPFHYGRWFRDSHRGWCWAPDTVWGPSWVSWRYNSGYCGWAPLPPGTGFQGGVGLTFQGRPVRNSDNLGLGPDAFHFVAWRHFNDRHLHNYGLPPREVAGLYAHTTPINRIVRQNNTVINQGIPRERVAAATHHQVAPVAMNGARPLAGRPGRSDANSRNSRAYRGQLPQSAFTRSPADLQEPLAGPAPSVQGAALGRPERLAARAPSAPSFNRGEYPPGSLILRGQSVLRATPARTEPLAPAADTVSPLGWAQSRQPSVRQDAGRSTPWLQNSAPFAQPQTVPAAQYAAPVAPAWQYRMPAYQPRPQPAPAEVPRYRSEPYYVPQRSYAPPSYSAPRQSAPAEAPRYSPAPTRGLAPSAPAAAQAGSSVANNGRR